MAHIFTFDPLCLESMKGWSHIHIPCVMVVLLRAQFIPFTGWCDFSQPLSEPCLSSKDCVAATLSICNTIENLCFVNQLLTNIKCYLLMEREKATTYIQWTLAYSVSVNSKFLSFQTPGHGPSSAH